MRTDTLMSLLAKKRLEQEPAPKLILKKKLIEKVCFLGISDEDIENFIIPQLVQWEIDGDFSKEKFNTFLKECPNLHYLQEPVRHEVDKTVEQRRMDSLARLLTVDNSITPCIAVAFYEGKLIVASNSPKEKTKEELEEYILQKMAIIRTFLTELAKDVTIEPDKIDVTKIQFSMRARLLAHRAIRHLIAQDCGGLGDLLPPQADRRRFNIEEHLKNALFKVGQAYLLSLYTDGKKGLSREDAQALSTTPITIVIPKGTELKQELHAEQAILYYLRNFTEFEKKPTVNRINIGISKLCCQACHTVLSRRADKIAYRGSHGVGFPNVHDIDTEDLFEVVKTRYTNLCAADSESECEFYDEPHDRVLSLQSLLRASGEKLPETSSHIKQHAQQMLFKPCRGEAKNEAACDLTFEHDVTMNI